MRLTSDFILHGAKPSKGDYNGKPYDSTKIYLELALKDGMGCCTVEYQWGDSSNYDKLKGLELPCDVSVDFELVTTGKDNSQQTIIHGLRPKRPAVKPAPTAP